MKSIFYFLRLIRIVNLLYIGLTQYLVQYTIIKPILGQAEVLPTLGDFHFFLLVMSTVCIAAGGYVINDYFDVKIDAINKPKRVFIPATHRLLPFPQREIDNSNGTITQNTGYAGM